MVLGAEEDFRHTVATRMSDAGVDAFTFTLPAILWMV
jgi:hypothetical protein